MPKKEKKKSKIGKIAKKKGNKKKIKDSDDKKLEAEELKIDAEISEIDSEIGGDFESFSVPSVGIVPEAAAQSVGMNVGRVGGQQEDGG